jgi:hypothetical protein
MILAEYRAVEELQLIWFLSMVVKLLDFWFSELL